MPLHPTPKRRVPEPELRERVDVGSLRDPDISESDTESDSKTREENSHSGVVPMPPSPELPPSPESPSPPDKTPNLPIQPSSAPERPTELINQTFGSIGNLSIYKTDTQHDTFQTCLSVQNVADHLEFDTFQPLSENDIDIFWEIVTNHLEALSKTGEDIAMFVIGPCVLSREAFNALCELFTMKIPNLKSLAFDHVFILDSAQVLALPETPQQTLNKPRINDLAINGPFKQIQSPSISLSDVDMLCDLSNLSSLELNAFPKGVPLATIDISDQLLDTLLQAPLEGLKLLGMYPCKDMDLFSDSQTPLNITIQLDLRSALSISHAIGLVRFTTRLLHSDSTGSRIHSLMIQMDDLHDDHRLYEEGAELDYCMVALDRALCDLNRDMKVWLEERHLRQLVPGKIDRKYHSLLEKALPGCMEEYRRIYKANSNIIPCQAE